MRHTMRVHSFMTLSRANGPGSRSVVWLQGCPLRCPGCFNPETHSSTGGHMISVDEVFNRAAVKDGITEGVTVSGGEPLAQFHPLVALLRRVRQETTLSSIVFTGYTWDEVQRMPEIGSLLGIIDVLVAGRYEAKRRLSKGLRGSANKTVHLLTARYTLADLEATPPAEILVTTNGDLVLSGIDPLQIHS